MGKIRVRTLGDESLEKAQAEKAKVRRDQKKLEKGKTHVKGVGLKGGQQISVMEGTEIKPEIQKILSQPAVDESVKKDTKKSKKIKKRLRSKRYQSVSTLIERNKSYNIKEALQLVKKTSTTKFPGTVETHININPATLPKDKPSLSGTVVLPHGTGKQKVVKIADEQLIEQVQKGEINFDVLVSHPSLMPKLARVARILGPKGLMPNPKNGTVTTDPEKRVKELQGGEINWKTEPDHPVIHQALGKVAFTDKQLEENLKIFIKSIGSSKIANLTLNATMGPSIKLDVTSI